MSENLLDLLKQSNERVQNIAEKRATAQQQAIEAALVDAREDFEDEKAKLISEHQKNIEALKTQNTTELEIKNTEFENKLANLKKEYETESAKIKSESETIINSLKTTNQQLAGEKNALLNENNQQKSEIGKLESEKLEANNKQEALNQIEDLIDSVEASKSATAQELKTSALKPLLDLDEDDVRFDFTTFSTDITFVVAILRQSEANTSKINNQDLVKLAELKTNLASLIISVGEMSNNKRYQKYVDLYQDIDYVLSKVEQ